MNVEWVSVMTGWAERQFGRRFDLSERRIDGDELLLNDYCAAEIRLEKRLNELKNRIGDICISDQSREKWRTHTKNMHLIGGLKQNVTAGIKKSQAFCKMYQILVDHPHLLKPRMLYRNRQWKYTSSVYTLSLCEAPGDFLAAIDYFICLYFGNIKWYWKANSLNPHYEYTKMSDMLLNDEFIVNNPHAWIFGDDNSGDVTKLQGSLSDLPRTFDLITADGSTYSQDRPTEQESIVHDIFIGEIECAFMKLRNGGSFVMKVYSTFTTKSTRIYVLFRRVFTQVTICKPPSSKGGNGERYAVCIGFKRNKYKEILKEYKEGIKEFIMSASMTSEELRIILECSTFFTNKQIESIELNLNLYPDNPFNKVEIQEQLNFLREYSVTKALREYKMYLLSQATCGFGRPDLFSPIISNPWTQQLNDNYIFNLKELEKRDVAIRFLSNQAALWNDEHERGDYMDLNDTRIEDIYIQSKHISFLNESIDEVMINVPWSIPSTKPIINSLFIDPCIWTSSRAISPHEFWTDMCSSGRPLTSKEFDDLIDKVHQDKDGSISISIDNLRSHSDWIKFLGYIHILISSSLISTLNLLLPYNELKSSKSSPSSSTGIEDRSSSSSMDQYSTSSSSQYYSSSSSSSSFNQISFNSLTSQTSYTFILSRFSASVISFLSIFFQSSHFPHPAYTKTNHILVQFTKPRRRLGSGIETFIDSLIERMEDNAFTSKECLSFVSIEMLSLVYKQIYEYNNEKLKILINSSPDEFHLDD